MNLDDFLDLMEVINRYRRGLETCPQAKTSNSGHAIFYSFFRRVRATRMNQRRVENTRVHFWTFSPVSVKRKNNRTSTIILIIAMMNILGSNPS